MLNLKKIYTYTYSLLFTVLLYLSNSAYAIDIDADNLFPKVKLETTMGNIIVELNRHKAPITVDNFLTYVVTGEYDNTVFHRVISNFVVQGGGYDENYAPKKTNENIFNESGNGEKNEQYTIAMARQNGPHTANRQFYFNVIDNKNLDPGSRWGYTVFGSIIGGEEVLTKIALVPTDFHASLGWSNVPVEKVLITKATLLKQ